MRVRSILSGAALALLVIGINPASAALVTVNSYDMINGNGVASSFFLNYWDGNYSPDLLGNRTTDNGILTGGKGALTDGIIPTLRWDNLSVLDASGAGKGKYVGWYTPLSGSPVITFHLAGNPTVNSVSMYVDASYNGLVGPPAQIWINGVGHIPTVSGYGGGVDPLCAGAFQQTRLCAEKLTVLGSWTGPTINVQPRPGNAIGEALQHGFQQEPWMMISEVQFTNAVPEPSTWAMMLIGFAGIGFVAYRRTRKGSTAVVAG